MAFVALDDHVAQFAEIEGDETCRRMKSLRRLQVAVDGTECGVVRVTERNAVVGSKFHNQADFV